MQQNSQGLVSFMDWSNTSDQGKPMLYTSKESLEDLEFRFSMKKYDFLKRKTIFEIFPIFIQRVSERKFSYF